MAASESDSVIVFLPEHRKAKGLGHLRRCYFLAQQLSGRIFLPFINNDAYSLDDLEARFTGISSYVCTSIPENTKWFVYDIPWIKADELKTDGLPNSVWQSAGRIALDCGGNGRDYMHYLIDTLPRTTADSECAPNCLADPVLEDLPARIDRGAGIQKILVVFGAEDINNTRDRVLEKISAIDQDSRIELHCIGGSSSHALVHPFDTNLAFTLHEYDLVITHFGLTAYEAAASGCEVLLLNPSDYHSQLSKLAGFSECTLQNIPALLTSRIKGHSTFQQIPKYEKKLLPILTDITSRNHVCCPLCGANNNVIQYRYETKSYALCAECELMHLFPLRVPKIEYNETYFFEAYEQQYGKTYLEDFDHIKSMGMSRVALICKLLFNVENPTILDIGCAYGPFLSAAADKGFDVYGTDIAEKAVDYCNSLGFKASQADFRRDNLAEIFSVPAFDVISMWYVIEHFDRLDTVLKSVYSILSDGGIFAFSTPSASGVSARFKSESFYMQSPDDHYSILDPRKIAKQLDMFGFELVHFQSTGHHPERFSKHFSKDSLLYGAGMGLSKLFRLGDTCEIYARKKSIKQ